MKMAKAVAKTDEAGAVVGFEPVILGFTATQIAQLPVDKLDHLMRLQERVRDDDARKSYNAAMNAAQGEMGRISADASNPQTRSRYATYGQLDKALRPIYSRHGFYVSFNTADSPLEQHVRVLATVAHSDGHEREFQADIPCDGKGAKGNDVMTKTHAAGSAMTYGQRYLLKLIFNVAIGENDDDGNGASTPTVLITDAQANQILALLSETKADLPRFWAWVSRLQGPTSNVSDIKSATFGKVLGQLQAKKAEMLKGAP
jgi:hypothetical protein